MSYSRLLEKYKQMLELFDCVHFNSTLTEGVYKDHVKVDSSKVVSITHSGVEDNRTLRTYESEVLTLIFIGATTTYKGFPMLESVLGELYDEGLTSWRLDVWGAGGNSDNDNIKYQGTFAAGELERVFHTDGVLVAPSVWNETFSLITLEAISFGTPTLVSSTVGAKDIVAEYDPWFVFESRGQLKDKLRELIEDRKRLKDFNNKIVTHDWHFSVEEHSQQIMDLYNQ